jgi:hypothetical protein
VLDDLGQFPDQPAGENWRVVSHAQRFPTLGDKRNALADLAPETTDAFVVLDDDEAYLPWTLRAHAWALQRSELSCPDRVFVEDSDLTLLMERGGVGSFHSSWAYSRNLFLRSGGYPSLNRREDLALLDVMLSGGAEPVSATDAWPPWLISRWEGTDSYHISKLEEDYESLAQPAESERTIIGMRPAPLRDWLALAIEFLEFGDPSWRSLDFQQAWQSRRHRAERKMIENRKRMAALRRRREVDVVGAPRSRLGRIL